MKEEKDKCVKCSTLVLDRYAELCSFIYPSENCRSVFSYGEKSFQFSDNCFFNPGINDDIAKFIDEYVKRQIILLKGQEAPILSWIKFNMIGRFRQLFIAVVAYLKYGYLKAESDGVLKVSQYCTKGMTDVEIDFVKLVMSCVRGIDEKKWCLYSDADDNCDGYRVIFSVVGTDSILSNPPNPKEILFVVDDLDRPRSDPRYCIPVIPDRKINMVCNWMLLCRSMIKYISGDITYFVDGKNYSTATFEDIGVCCFCRECDCSVESVKHDFEYLVVSNVIGLKYDDACENYEFDHIGEDNCLFCSGSSSSNSVCLTSHCYGKCVNVLRHFFLKGELHRHMCCMGSHVVFKDDEELYGFVAKVLQIKGKTFGDDVIESVILRIKDMQLSRCVKDRRKRNNRKYKTYSGLYAPVRKKGRCKKNT